MHRFYPWIAICSIMTLALFVEALANEPVTLENVKDPGPNKLDEPMAKAFSLDKAVHFMDSAALNWQKKKNCFSCHTNYSYLYARPMVSAEGPALQEVRKFAEELVTEQWPKKGPRYIADTVATAMALSFHDAATTNKLHPVTKQAFEWMWKKQRKDGGWDWLKCNWPPMEVDDHYGVTLAAIAVGAAPGDYAKSDEAQKGLAGIKRYLNDHPPATLHHEFMILWAASYLDGFMTNEDKQACVEKLFALQKKDGGWNVASMGNWKRNDGKQQDTVTSDGYATGFAIYVLRRSGIPAADGRMQKGIAWLKSHQRQSGRWITRSLNRDNKHYLSHAGTAFAMMALASCDALEK